MRTDHTCLTVSPVATSLCQCCSGRMILASMLLGSPRPPQSADRIHLIPLACRSRRAEKIMRARISACICVCASSYKYTHQHMCTPSCVHCARTVCGVYVCTLCTRARTRTRTRFVQ